MVTFVYLYVLLLSLVMTSAIDTFLKHISFWRAFRGNIAEMPFVQNSMIYVGVFGILICVIEDIQRSLKNKAAGTDSKSKESNKQ